MTRFGRVRRLFSGGHALAFRPSNDGHWTTTVDSLPSFVCLLLQPSTLSPTPCLPFVFVPFITTNPLPSLSTCKTPPNPRRAPPQCERAFAAAATLSSRSLPCRCCVSQSLSLPRALCNLLTSYTCLLTFSVYLLPLSASLSLSIYPYPSLFLEPRDVRIFPYPSLHNRSLSYLRGYPHVLELSRSSPSRTMSRLQTPGLPPYFSLFRDMSKSIVATECGVFSVHDYFN
jgi:hypothetical protein